MPRGTPVPGSRSARALSPSSRGSRDAGSGGEPADGRARLVLAICCFSLFMAQLDATVVNVGLPAIGRELHAGIADLQWVVDAYVLALASLAMSSGAAGDRVGRRRVFQTGLVTFTLCSLACSLAPSVGALIAFRLVQGAGASMLMPVTLSIIANTFADPRARAQAIGIWAAVAGLAAAAGPLLGGALVDAIGWRAIFWINLPIGALALGLTTRFILESRAPSPQRADLAGQALVGMFVAALTYALIQAPSARWGSLSTLGLLAVAGVSLAGFVAVELRTATPLLDVRLLRRPPLAGATSVAVLAYLALMGFLFLNTLYLQQVRGLGPIVAGLAIVPFPVALVVASPLAGRLVGTHGPRGLIAGGGAAIAAGMLILLSTTPTTPYLQLLGVYLLLGAGWGLLNAPITNVAVSAMPARQAGVASAVAGTARQIGAVLGVALLGSLTATRLGPLLPDQAGAPLGSPHLFDSAAGRADFTSATHLGYLAGALAALVIVPIAATTMRRARPDQPRQPGADGSAPSWGALSPADRLAARAASERSDQPSGEVDRRR